MAATRLGIYTAREGLTVSPDVGRPAPSDRFVGGLLVVLDLASAGADERAQRKLPYERRSM